MRCLLLGLQRGCVGEQRTHPREIVGGVHTRAGCCGRDVNRNAVAMPQGPQLLQGLGDFQRGLGQCRKGA